MILVPKSPQAVADAYYVLSDPTRRKEYDHLYSARRPNERTAQPDASGNFFSAFNDMFGKPGGSGAGARAPPTERPDADHVFADVFDEVRAFLCNSRPQSQLTPCQHDSCSALRLSGMLRGGHGWGLSVVPA